ncbi:MAG: hypothetical protein ACYCSP_05970 [Acidobacteriaceae bacterium]
MADSRAQAYAEQLNLLTKQADALSPEARLRILKLLDDLNREVLGDLARTKIDSYSAARLQALKAEIDRNMEQFAQQASSQVQQMQANAYKQTAQQVDATVTAGIGGVVVQPVIDTAMLQVVQGYTADLIGGLSRDAAAKINAAIQRGFLGGMNLSQLVDEIGTTLEGGKFSGLFSPIGERAMTIATNEIMRVQSLASMARINDLATRHKDLMKRWRHTPVAKIPRISHILADKQVRKPSEPFLVNGEELQYPRDPSGTPGNTINCHCLVQPYFSEDALKPTDQERALLQSHGLSVTTQAV